MNKGVYGLHVFQKYVGTQIGRVSSVAFVTLKVSSISHSPRYVSMISISDISSSLVTMA